MNQEIIAILGTVGIVVLGFLVSYFKTKSGLIGKVAEYISYAEEVFKDYTKAGEQKFNLVVDSLYALVPTVFKPILSKQILGVITQGIFEEVQKFLTTNLDKVVDKTEEVEAK